jgi:hypothetical protein
MSPDDSVSWTGGNKPPVSHVKAALGRPFHADVAASLLREAATEGRAYKLLSSLARGDGYVGLLGFALCKSLFGARLG